MLARSSGGHCPRLWHGRGILCRLAAVQLLLLAVPSPLAAPADQQPPGQWQPQLFDAPLVTGCGRGGTHATAAILNELGAHAQHEGFAGEHGVSVGWMYGAPMGAEETVPWGNDRAIGRYPFERNAWARVHRMRSFSPVVLLVRHPLDVIGSVRRCFCAIGLRNGTKKSATADSHSWLFVESKLNVTRFLPDIRSWAALPVTSLRRAMVYWAGWNTLVEETHALRLAGYDGSGGGGNSYDDAANEARWLRRLRLVQSSANHTVRLEDPHMPRRLAELLRLPRAVQDKATRDQMHNTKAGKSAVDDATRAATRASWSDLFAADRPLAQRVWAMAQRYGYETEQPPQLAQFLQLPM